MTVGDNPPTELDEFLSRAVDRQIAEQRALREALLELRAAVDALSRRPSGISEFDQSAFDERVVHLASELQDAAREGIAAMHDATKRDIAEIRDATRAELATVRESIKGDVSGAHEGTRTEIAQLRENTTSDLVSLKREVEDIKVIVRTELARIADAAPVDIEAIGKAVAANAPQFDTDEIRRLVADIPQVDMDEIRAVVAVLRPDDTENDDVREQLATVNANLEGIAAALIDLSAGLRDWASGVDDGIANLTRGVSSVRKMADATRSAVDEAREAALGARDASEQARDLNDQTRDVADQAREAAEEARAAAEAANQSLALEVAEPEEVADDVYDERLEAIEARVEETVDLAKTLSAQLEGFERAAVSMREIPTTIEAAVAQALRRAMAARAKLDKEAEAAIDETLGALDEHMEALSEAIGQIQTNDEQIRKIALGQVELASRLETLQDSFLARLEDVTGERRAPRSAEPAAKSTRSRSAPPKKTTSKRTTRTTTERRSPRRTPSAPPDETSR